MMFNNRLAEDDLSGLKKYENHKNVQQNYKIM